MKVFAKHRSRLLTNGAPYKRYFTEIQWKLLPKEKDGTRGGWTQIRPEPAILKKVSKPSNSGGLNATRGAIQLAEENDVDLTKVEGTGDEGRISKNDVQDFIDNNS